MEPLGISHKVCAVESSGLKCLPIPDASCAATFKASLSMW